MPNGPGQLVTQGKKLKLRFYRHLKSIHPNAVWFCLLTTRQLARNTSQILPIR
jgi:hypothetical protein